MSRKRFFKGGTYGDWEKVHPEDTKYVRGIKRKHLLYPNKSLSELNKIKIGDFDLSQIPWNSLSAQDKRDRILSLQIPREMRKGENLYSVLKKLGKGIDFALKHLGKYLYKSGKNWKFSKTDRIQAEMPIYSTEGQKTIVTTSSDDRSLIGEYFACVQKAVKNNDSSVLAKFKDVKIIDAEGKVYYFETDLDKLYEILEAQEEPEFLEIYQH